MTRNVAFCLSLLTSFLGVFFFNFPFQLAVPLFLESCLQAECQLHLWRGTPISDSCFILKSHCVRGLSFSQRRVPHTCMSNLAHPTCARPHCFPPLGRVLALLLWGTRHSHFPVTSHFSVPSRPYLLPRFSAPVPIPPQTHFSCGHVTSCDTPGAVQSRSRTRSSTTPGILFYFWAPLAKHARLKTIGSPISDWPSTNPKANTAPRHTRSALPSTTVPRSGPIRKCRKDSG